jgi:hypothetical protein
MKDGGWLDKYQPGGAVAKTDATRVAAPALKLTKAQLEKNKAINKQVMANTNKAKEAEVAKRTTARNKPGKTVSEVFTSKEPYEIQERFRLFPGDTEYGQVFDEYINPAYFTTQMASDLGNSLQSGDYKGAALTAGMALGAGALGFDPLGGAMKLPGKLDKAIYPTRTYRASVPGGNPPIYESSVLADKVAGKGDWTTKDLRDAVQYLSGSEAEGARPGLLTGQNMNLTEYKVPFWKNNITKDADVVALKNLQGADINPAEYIIPDNKFLYPRRTNTIQAVPENVKGATANNIYGEPFTLYEPGKDPLSYSDVQYSSPAYKYVEDQINAVTGQEMPYTFDFSDFRRGISSPSKMYDWQQPQFAPNEGIGEFKRFENGGWLDKYNDGGPVQPNYNDSNASAGPDFEGDGYSNVGRNYSPAWGGQFQDGGKLSSIYNPKLRNMLEGYKPGFMDTVGDYRLPEGYMAGSIYPSTEVSTSIGGEGGEPSYLIPSFKYGQPLQDPIQEFNMTGQHLGGPFKTWQDAEKFGELRHQYVEKGQPLPSPIATSNMAMGGSIGGATQGIPGATGFMYARTGTTPSNGKYAKKTMASAQKGKQIGPDDLIKEIGKIKKGDYSIKPTYADNKQNISRLESDLQDYLNVENATNSAQNYIFQNNKANDWGLHNGPLDAVRHAASSAQTSSQLANMFPGMKYNPGVMLASVLGTNALGFAHELSSSNPLEEMGSDVYNNLVGSVIGVLPGDNTKRNERINSALNSNTLSNMKGKNSGDKPFDPRVKTTIDDSKNKSKNFIKGVGPLSNERLKELDLMFNVFKLENGGEMKYYQEGLDFKPKSISKNGSVIKDDMGQWAHPGEVTEIGSNQITMQGVDYPVLGISDTGDTQMMYPNEEYEYDGESVTEYPMMQNGGWLDALTDAGKAVGEIGKGVVDYVGGLFEDPAPVVKPKAVPVKPKLDAYDTILDLGFNNPQRRKLQQQLDKGFDYSEDKNKIKLATGRFTGANVSSRLIDDLALAAKRNNIPIGKLLTLAGRESTFGEEKGNTRHGMGSDSYVSGWNVAEDYKTYDPHRFLADKKVPGINVVKTSHGYNYEVADEKAVREYLKKHPKLLEQYKMKVAETPDIGNKNYFDLTAEFLKKKGVKGYNPGDPRYVQMFNKDYDTLKQDKQLMSYLTKKGYKYEQGGQLAKLDQLTNFTNYNTKQPGGWLDKYQ